MAALKKSLSSLSPFKKSSKAPISYQECTGFPYPGVNVHGECVFEVIRGELLPIMEQEVFVLKGENNVVSEVVGLEFSRGKWFIKSETGIMFEAPKGSIFQFKTQKDEFTVLEIPCIKTVRCLGANYYVVGCFGIKNNNYVFFNLEYRFGIKQTQFILVNTKELKHQLENPVFEEKTLFNDMEAYQPSGVFPKQAVERIKKFGSDEQQEEIKRLEHEYRLVDERYSNSSGNQGNEDGDDPYEKIEQRESELSRIEARVETLVMEVRSRLQEQEDELKKMQQENIFTKEKNKRKTNQTYVSRDEVPYDSSQAYIRLVKETGAKFTDKGVLIVVTKKEEEVQEEEEENKEVKRNTIVVPKMEQDFKKKNSSREVWGMRSDIPISEFVLDERKRRRNTMNTDVEDQEGTRHY